MVTDAEMVRQIKTEEKRLRVMAEYAFLQDKCGQLRTNLERMEREGTTAEPCPSIDGKTQYEVDRELKVMYEEQLRLLLAKNKTILRR